MLACSPVSTKVMRQSSMSLSLERLFSLAVAVEHEVVGEGLVVVEEVLLDDVGLVAEAQHEVLVAVVGVVLHDMPQNRAVPDRDHGLRDPLGMIAEP